MRVKGEGPIPARVMLVGEAPGENEERAGTPFVGASGQELNRMLHEAGIMRSECYVTNVCKLRPPNNQISAFVAAKKKDRTAAHVLLRDRYVLPPVVDGYKELLAEIAVVQPNIIVAFGNLAMWALTGQWGILKWRGSQMQTDVAEHKTKLIPTIHPAAILREWSYRAVVLSDLRRVRRHMTTRSYDNKPAWCFTVRPSFARARDTLLFLLTCLNFNEPMWIDLDIETRHGHIDSIGLSWSRTEAICIPLISAVNRAGYWQAEEEAHLIWLLYKILTHKAVKVRWQNGLYDAQYIYRHWHFIPHGAQDTMISQHSLFCALPKGLSFLASMYADWYVYWKDEGKIAVDALEERRWTYNLQDCIYTREVGETLTATAAKMNLAAVDAQQQELFYPVLRAMLRGVKVRPDIKMQMAQDIQEEISHREAFLFKILGHSINPSSPKQMQALFYEDLRQPPVLKRSMLDGRPVMRPTCDDEALTKIAAREPLLKPICHAIADLRTLNKFYGDFVMMQLDSDGRMRCSFNIAGDAGGKSAPYSYRLSSSKNPFGSGGNLQTIPSEKSKSSGKAAARGSMDFTLPNIRSMYGPDTGFTFFDMDLDRADLQVVVWESDDAMLKQALRLGVDIHLLNVYAIDKKDPPPLEELVETHPKYPDHRGPRKHKREFSKVFCHACITGDHEILTPLGWKLIKDLVDGESIAVWNKETAAISFEVPKSVNRDTAKKGEILIEFKGQAISQHVTADHRMPYLTDTNLLVATADSLPHRARLPVVGLFSGAREVDEAFIRLLAAFQADGFFDYKYRTGWHFKKQRKIDRLLELARQAGLIPIVQSKETTRIFLHWRPETWMKVPGAWMLELNGQALDWWLDELKYWDGWQGSTGAIHISTSNQQTAEWINTIAHLRGKGSQCYIHTEATETRKANWHVSLNRRQYVQANGLQITKTKQEKDIPVFCPQTSTGFFMVRREGKISVTGNTNYVGGARTVAAHTGRSVHEIDQAQKLWFGAHPGIKHWHDRTLAQITKHRFVENRWGYRWYMFDRLEGLLPEAVAWVPQSTVGILINKIWIKFYNELPEVQVLLQVHDSLAGQIPTHRAEAILPKMRDASRIIIPYEDPLIIPTGIKTSTVSWGDCT